MSILGEVRVTHLKCMQRFTQDMGATEVIDVQCRIAVNASGKATIRASLHIRTVTFDDEEWKIITLMCIHMAGYETLFAPSCGSVGTSLTFSRMRRATLQSLLKCSATTFLSDD